MLRTAPCADGQARLYDLWCFQVEPDGTVILFIGRDSYFVTFFAGVDNHEGGIGRYIAEVVGIHDEFIFLVGQYSEGKFDGFAREHGRGQNTFAVEVYGNGIVIDLTIVIEFDVDVGCIDINNFEQVFSSPGDLGGWLWEWLGGSGRRPG